VTIGAHTVNHRRLDAWHRGSRRGIAESKAQLEKILGTSVVLFSFPHEPTMKACSSLRGKLATNGSSVSHQDGFEGATEFNTGRVLTDPSDWLLEFRLKLLGAYRWLVPISKWKQLLSSRSAA